MDIDISQCNDSQIAELWHAAHRTVEQLEKELQDSPEYVRAKEMIEAIKEVASKRLHDYGATSIATPFGTIHTVGKTTARIVDPQAFQDWVWQRPDGKAFLDWKANMSACRSYMTDESLPVPGIELSTFHRLSITAPRAAPKGKDND